MYSTTVRARRCARAGLCLVFSFFVGALPAGLSAQSSPPAEPPSPANHPLPTGEHVFPTGDYELHAWLVEQLGQVPDNDGLKKITKAELPRFHKLVDDAILGGDYHLENHPKSPLRPMVARIQARLLVLNHTRYVVGEDNAYRAAMGNRMPRNVLDELNKEYLARIQSLVEEALGEANKFTGLLLAIRAENESLQFDPATAAKTFKKSLEIYPENPNAELITATRIDHLIRGDKPELFAEAASEAQAYLNQRPCSRYLADVFFMLHKTTRFLGKPDLGIQLWEKYGPKLRALADGNPAMINGTECTVAEGSRTPFDGYADRDLFYRGFFHFAAGRVEEAQSFLEQFMDVVNQKTGSISNATNVYMTYQAVPMHQFIIAQHGNPAADLKAERWVIEPHDKVEPGLVSFVLFCPIERARSRQFALMKRLEKIAKDYWGRGLRVHWVSNCQPTRDRPLDYYEDEMVKLLDDFRLTYSAGIELGSTLETHRAFGLDSVGTANLFAVDKAGKMVWRIIDPMGHDEGLLRHVADRLLKERHSQ